MDLEEEPDRLVADSSSRVTHSVLLVICAVQQGHEPRGRAAPLGGVYGVRWIMAHWESRGSGHPNSAAVDSGEGRGAWCARSGIRAASLSACARVRAGAGLAARLAVRSDVKWWPGTRW